MKNKSDPSFFPFLFSLPTHDTHTDICKEATLHLVLRLRGMISSFTSSTESYLTWKIVVKSESITAPLTHENNIVTQAAAWNPEWGFAGTLTANLGSISTTVTVKSAIGQTLDINEDMSITLANDASGVARDPILIPAANIVSATFVTTEADVLTTWLLLSDEERAVAPTPPTAVLTERMTELQKPLGADKQRAMCKTFTTKTPEQTSTLINPSQREVCKRFMDAAHSIICAESSDMKITLSQESFCVLFPGDDSNAQYTRLMAEHPSDSKLALRRTEGPVDGCIDFHCDATSHAHYTATHTVQIALNDDTEYNGGRLCYFSSQGGLTVTSRPAGTLTSHSAVVLHAVTKLHSGIRYGLFVVDTRNGLGEKDVHHLKTDKVTAIVAVANAVREAAENAAAEDETTNDKNCCVCMDKGVDSAPVPCGHVCMCWTCLNRLFASDDPKCVEFFLSSFLFFSPCILKLSLTRGFFFLFFLFYFPPSSSVVRCPICRSDIESVQRLHQSVVKAGFKTVSTALAETFESQGITRVEARKALDESNGDVVVSCCAVVVAKL